MQRRWIALTGAVGAACVLAVGPALLRAASPVVNSTVAIVDPYTPVQQAGVDSSGNLKVAVSGSLTANQSVNVAQINGVTPLMGNGATGTGSHRVTLSNDNTVPTGWPTAANQTAWQGATGAAPTANVAYMGGNGSGATGGLLRGLITCDSYAKYNASDNGSITLITGVSGRKIYICGYVLSVSGTSVTLKFTEGTDANCVTSAADVTPGRTLAINGDQTVMSAFWTGLVTATAGNFLCINSSAGNPHQAQVWYTIL